MSWYKRAMPTVKDIEPVVSDICRQVKALRGVKHVYAWGSYVDHIASPNYVVKDLDIIACTNFDAGDLLAIDNSKYSALKIRPSELEDMGFNPDAVSFTKGFLSLEKFNVDHWAASSDGKLLHWGAIPDTQDDWSDLHARAEESAEKTIGTKRAALSSKSEDVRKAWRGAYDQYIRKYLSSNATGWYPSDHPVDDILLRAKLLG